MASRRIRDASPRWCTRCGTGPAAGRSAPVRKENGVGSASPGCASNCDQSMRPAIETRRRAGLQARPCSSPGLRNWSPNNCDGASPFRPQLYFISPTWAKPFRKVPVVTTTAAASHRVRPSRKLQRPVEPRPVPPIISAATSACLMRRVRLASPAPRAYAKRYSFLSICARGDQTAGPAAGIQQAELDAHGVGHPP
jgi:hypothetical protein